MDIVTKSSLRLNPVSCNDTSALNNVNSVSFLGVTLSNDLKWNLHFDKCIKKACKRIFLIRNLRRARCSSSLLFRVYVSFIRSTCILLYAVPCFCNAPKHLFDKFLRIERRIFRIIGPDSSSFPSLSDAVNTSCCKLFNNIDKFPNHSLRHLFSNRFFSSTRSTSTPRPPLARTCRFKNSFIRFCK